MNKFKAFGVFMLKQMKNAMLPNDRLYFKMPHNLLMVVLGVLFMIGVFIGIKLGNQTFSVSNIIEDKIPVGMEIAIVIMMSVAVIVWLNLIVRILTCIFGKNQR